MLLEIGRLLITDSYLKFIYIGVIELSSRNVYSIRENKIIYGNQK